jgi:glutathione synthase
MQSAVRLLVVMDPIDRVKFGKDTTLAILIAAQARGWQLGYVEQSDLRLRDGVAEGRVRSLTVRADAQSWFTLGAPQVELLGDFDVILMRKDPPFDTQFIYTSYILERAELAGALVVNRARGLRDMNEKVYTAWFARCCAPTLITRDMEEMAAFARTHGKIVCKPLHSMGGHSIFALEPGDKNARVVYETLTQDGTQFAVVQKYLPDIVIGGDSRVLLIDGEPVPYALARIPSADDHRGNLAAGAKGVGRPLNDRDRWLCQQIGPAMREAGMVFVGLDVIGGFVTEINVTSPTGVRELDNAFGINIGAMLIDAIARRLPARAS